jgi:hypothetical protein
VPCEHVHQGPLSRHQIGVRLALGRGAARNEVLAGPRPNCRDALADRPELPAQISVQEPAVWDASAAGCGRAIWDGFWPSLSVVQLRVSAAIAPAIRSLTVLMSSRLSRGADAGRRAHMPRGLDRLLDRVRGGESAVLVIRGEAGIGKPARRTSRIGATFTQPLTRSST